MEEWIVVGWVIAIIKWIAIIHAVFSVPYMALEILNAKIYERATEFWTQFWSFLLRNVIIVLVFLGLLIKAALFDLLLHAIRGI